MVETIGVAVVGAGMAGEAHAHAFRAAGMHPALDDLVVDLVAVVDPDLGRARDVARRYGYRHATGHLADVVADANVRAVAVALPNDRYV
jgi:predicted dehydrogenase